MNKEVKKPDVKVGVGVIIRKNNKFLVGVRQGSHGEGQLAFPGGHVESDDESLAFCGEREVNEETGIICNVIKPDGIRDDLFTTFDILSEDGTKVYATIYLLADYVYGGDIQQDTEGKHYIVGREKDKCPKWEWLTLQEIIKAVDNKTQNWIPIKQIAYYLKDLKNG